MSMLLLTTMTMTAQLTTRITNNVGAGKVTKGDSMKNILLDMLALNTIAPTYTAPTTTISSTITAGNYEIGSALNSTLSSTFTQNDAGALSTTIYYKNAVALGSNTDNITSLTTTANYIVTKTYAQGPCKTNNVGATDCTGRISAGTVTSAALTLTPLPKVYYGFASTQTPIDAQIRALTGSLRGSLGTISGSFGAQSGTYLVISYPASFPDLTSILVGGFESISSFTKTTASLTNDQSYTQSYKKYISNFSYTTSSVTLSAQ